MLPCQTSAATFDTLYYCVSQARERERGERIRQWKKVMPKRKVQQEGSGAEEEQDEEQDGGSQPEEKLAKEPKKAKKEAAAKKQGDGSGVSNKIELGRNKFVDVREFKGMVLVDIREYYEKDGQMKPGKKGIALSAEQWEVLKERMDDITSKVEALTD